MPKLVTSVAAQAGEDRMLTVPVEIDGRVAPLLVSTDDPWSMLSGRLVDRLGLHRAVPGRIRFVNPDQDRFHSIVRADAVKLGDVAFKSAKEFLVDDIMEDGGTFGMNFLADYDFEIDTARKTLALYAHETCGRPSAAWARGAVEIPFRMRDEVAVATVELNGRPVSAVFGTGDPGSWMSLSVAKAQFGITPDLPGVTPLGQGRFANGREVFDRYRYTFDELYVSGLRFENVPVVLLDTQSYGFQLGMHELKHLHLFFAFAKGKVYAAVNDAR